MLFFNKACIVTSWETTAAADSLFAVSHVKAIILQQFDKNVQTAEKRKMSGISCNLFKLLTLAIVGLDPPFGDHF